MTLETITQTMKSVAQRWMPDVKIVAHHLVPNDVHSDERPPHSIYTVYIANDVGFIAKVLGLTFIALGALPGGPRNSEIIYWGVAAESLGIILQNGVYDNVKRWYKIKGGS